MISYRLMVEGLVVRSNSSINCCGNSSCIVAVLIGSNRVIFVLLLLLVVVVVVPSKLGWIPRHCWKNGVKPPLFLFVSFVLSATPQTGGNGQGI